MKKDHKKDNVQLNLYQKLLEVRKNISYIQKTATGHRFKYADETAILSAVRPIMDEHNLFLDFEMEEPKLLENGSVQVCFIFTWVNCDNPDEKLVKRLYLQTAVANAQAMGGLMTYAMRYFLYKYFNVPTAELDPDSYQNQTGKMSVDQVAHLETLINGDQELRKRMLEWAGADNLAQITPDKYQPILRAIDAHKKAKKEAADAAGDE